MTPAASISRLILYVLSAMVMAASGGLASVDFTDAKQVAGYALGIIATGLITARSYIDKSPSQVVPPSQ